ncbi:glycosyltransferase [Streptomyces sp. NPDC051784]|uniref:glycosyltransferase n=1 Tax=Streptomyces sp. NPDC051784 TaxID=3155805 RepID=UPI0034213428
MRVVIVTESFPPDTNGVAHCTLQTARHLAARGHQPLVTAPAGATGSSDPAHTGDPCPVVRVPSLPLPGYPQVRVALPGRRLAAALTAHRAELVHLAGPFVLGARGMAVAARPGPPAVAVYQTDLAGYARTCLGAGESAAWRRMRAVHRAADLTLAPSSAALRDLTAHGVPRVRLWPRGVDTERFHACARGRIVCTTEWAAGSCASARATRWPGSAPICCRGCSGSRRRRSVTGPLGTSGRREAWADRALRVALDAMSRTAGVPLTGTGTAGHPEVRKRPVPRARGGGRAPDALTGRFCAVSTVVGART